MGMGSAVSPLDWSDDWLWFPTDMADSFDLNEGDIAMVLAADTEGVNRPLLETDEMVVLVAAFDGVDVLIVDELLAEKDEGGDFPLRNWGVFRNFRPGVRPRRFSDGLGESAGSAPWRSDSFENPETDRPLTR